MKIIGTDDANTNYGEAIIDYDDELRIVSCDTLFTNLTGYDYEYLRDNRVLLRDVVRDEKGEPLKKNVLNQLESYSSIICRVSLVKKNGENINLNVCLELVIDDMNHSVAKIFILDGGNSYIEIFDKVVKSVPVGIGIVSVDDTIIVRNANDEFYKSLGFNDMTHFILCTGTCLENIFPDKDYVFKQFVQAFNSKETVEFQAAISYRNYKKRWISFKTKFFDIIDDMPYFQLYVTNVTMEKALEDQILLALGNRSMMADEAFKFSYEIKADTLYIPVSGNTDDIIVHNLVSNERWKNFITVDDWNKLVKEYQNVTDDKTTIHTDFKFMINRERDSQDCRLFCRKIFDENGNPLKIVGRIINVTVENSIKEKLEQQLIIDSVSGLFNKEYIRSKLDEIIDRGVSRPVFMLISVENLDSVFENLGHLYADTLVQRIAVSVKNVLRPEDVFGRLGYNLFAVIFSNVDEEIVYNKGLEIYSIISMLKAGNGTSDFLDARVGITKCLKSDTVNLIYGRGLTAIENALDMDEHVCVHNINDNVIDSEFGENAQDLFYRMENYDMEFLSFAFDLLINSRDIDKSVAMLLDRIGEKFELDSIIISSNDSKKKCETVFMLWKADKGVVKIKPVSVGYSDLPGYLESYDSKGMVCVENEVDVYPEPKGIKLDINAKSFVKCAYYIEDKLGGFVDYIDSDKYRNWKEYDKGTLYEVTRVLSIFISLQRERQSDRAMISDLSTRDQLTNLYNAETFEEIVRGKLLNADPEKMYYFICTDINNFAAINEVYGQTEGDRVLKDFSSLLLSRGVADSCRVYSDLFLSFGMSDDEDTIVNRVLKINGEFEKNQAKRYPLTSIKVCTGIYTFYGAHIDIETCIDNANLARKNAKKHGKNLGLYDEELKNKRTHDQMIAGAYNDAIINGEFKLYLQPKFALDTKEVIGAEALVRWIKADGTVTYPDEFIPLFEQMGQIINIDMYIYEQVLINLDKWKKSGKQVVPVSVNFSRRHLENDEFASELKVLADQYEVDYSNIEIEITESILANNKEQMLTILNEIKSIGFKINIDDFGTGYSSLNMLIDAPVDVVKVDKSFMDNTSKSENAKNYVEHIAGLIVAANKDIIFEGVETEEQAEFLLAKGYNKAQGWLFDKAIDVSEFEKKYI